jgi:hypothetical protein
LNASRRWIKLQRFLSLNLLLNADSRDTAKVLNVGLDGLKSRGQVGGDRDGEVRHFRLPYVRHMAHT